MLPPAGAALALAFAAVHLRTPAPDVARLCVQISGGLVLVNLVAWVAREGDRFGREERLWAFVVFAAVAMGYYLSMQAIAEREFDAIVQVQQRELVETSVQLSRELDAFVDGRLRAAPARPTAPDTWDRDQAAWTGFEQDTSAAYAARFARRVRLARAELTFRNLRDRDLDAFYRSPMNAFQVRVVAQRLAVLADRLRRAVGPS
jgi:hypothetical protein